MTVFVPGRLDVLRERVGHGGRVTFQRLQSRDHFVIDCLQVQYHQVRLRTEKKRLKKKKKKQRNTRDRTTGARTPLVSRYRKLGSVINRNEPIKPRSVEEQRKRSLRLLSCHNHQRSVRLSFRGTVLEMLLLNVRKKKIIHNLSR
jgi:hypothetical protein